MVMTIRVMSSGKGYEYLLRSVVVGDGDREMSSPLTRYYTESGCPPGTWVGTGLTSLDDGRSPALAEGDTVTEEHLAGSSSPRRPLPETVSEGPSQGSGGRSAPERGTLVPDVWGKYQVLEKPQQTEP